MENKQDILIGLFTTLMDNIVQAQRDYDKVFGDTHGSDMPYMALDMRSRLNDIGLNIHGCLQELQNDNMY